MRRLLPVIAAVTGLFASVATAAADAPPSIVIDVNTGKVLESNNSDALWHPASLTKLMTAYVVFEALRDGDLKLTSPVKVSAHALAQAPAKMGYKVGTVINVDNALKMMLVKSANDIAVAVAESVGGSEPKFVARMNATAQRLGMVSTHYDDANGLPSDGQLTTARDLAVLARAIFTDFPEYVSYFGIPAIKAGKRVLRSENDLLERYQGTIGMKTGFICASGYNIVASARRGNRTLIAIVLGAPSADSRGAAAAHLLDDGFATWLTQSKPDLASFETTPAVGPAADLHSVVCTKHDDPDVEGASDTVANAGLGPRFFLMDPVPVFTGHADGYADASAPVAKTGKKTVAADAVPLPHLRP
ncbi:MAG TPA: D-alanyl-D-alanine carboxypeptidase family protein [Bauldia sp.]|nr:D-alanyl-D-alanine carboxypeptidase family protein [Bauldia sp.]